MLLLLFSYYILDFSFGVIWWTSSTLYNGVVYLNSSNPLSIENTKIDDDYVFIDSYCDIKKEIKELRKLILDTTNTIKL